MSYVTPKQAAKVLGVHVSSLRRWESQGKLKTIRTPGGQRRYDLEEVEKAACLPKPVVTVCYARVSTHSQRDDLERQTEFLRSKFPDAELLSDIGSGLNFRRRKFLAILDRILTVPMPTECIYGTELVYQRGKWFACIPVRVEEISTSNSGVIALDPGNRAFLTGYDGENVLEIGQGDIGRINRLCSHLDNLLSRAALSPSKRQRHKMRKAANRIRERISCLVKDLHNKVTSLLVRNYKLIFLPTYETSQMVVKSARKLNRKSVRNMLTWSHAKFASHLEQMARRHGVLVIRCNESYTSKTCTNCGHIHSSLGGSKIFNCRACGIRIKRDVNGARNIMLRALQATAFIITGDAVLTLNAAV
ncbi:RNA-guided endonuclease TnpB family protein [Coleofasciculus sp.]|uniref:RNA-guided endonuclease TnpB family protein n=2 Tax=unclassified Coleofasciculus TaxID=2692782 RepID=UPI0037EAF42C